MFRTSVNRFNVVDATPWHHDPLADLSAAAHSVRVLRAVPAGRREMFHDLTAPAGPISLGGDATARLV